MSNKIETIKKDNDQFKIEEALFRYADLGWQKISDDDKERLKWWGIFFRKPTPGLFMMRVRITNGMSHAQQMRILAKIATDFGKGFLDITTRQQIQLRNMTIEQIPEIMARLKNVGLTTQQTGIDNIRNVVGCPVAGLSADELFDASFVTKAYTDAFIGNKDYMNLPRKFNVTMTACPHNCTEAETQDIGMIPAIKDGKNGLNVLVGGKNGSGGLTTAWPLNLFTPPETANEIAVALTLLFRDHGPRQARNKCRFSYLIQDWGIEKIRSALEEKLGKKLDTAGEDQRNPLNSDHIGIFRQKQEGLNYAGLLVPVGRIRSDQLLRMADLAETYGNGEIRLSTGQNIILPNIPDDKLRKIQDEPLLQSFSYAPSEIIRGIVSCTGSEYCGLALIETKNRATSLAQHLEKKLADNIDKLKPISTHWSGCPSGCGNHTIADVGLQGAKARVNGQVVDAAHVFIRGEKLLESVPCQELPSLMETFVPHLVRLKKRLVPEQRELPPEKRPAPESTALQTINYQGQKLAVYKVGNQLYGIEASCPHEGGPLDEGSVDGICVRCPWHDYQFDLRDGSCRTDPQFKVKTYEIEAKGETFVVVRQNKGS